MFTADPIQPDVEFAFGEQPSAFRNVDNGKKVGAIGSGDVWVKFILPQELQRGSDLYVTCRSESKRATVKAGAIKAGVPENKIHVVGSMNDFPKDMHRIYILTPPNSHAALVEEISAKFPGTPIGVEKPLTGCTPDAMRLDNFAQASGAPVYTIDWMILDAQPLFYAFGLPIAYPEGLNIQNGARFKEFNVNGIVKIDGRDIEGGGNSLADPAKLAADRPWMFDMNDAGGVLWDMISHLVNLCEDLGFRTKKINEGYLGAFSKEQGIYDRIGNNDEKTSDMYARVHMVLTREGNDSEIGTVMECGKNAQYNDQFIEFTDNNGCVLHWEIIPVDGKTGKRIPGSILTLHDASGKEIASVSMRTDAYALVADEFSKFADQWHAGMRPPQVPTHLDAQVRGINTIVEMHKIGRSVTIEDGEKVRQLALMESSKTGKLSNFSNIQQLSA